MKIAVWDTYVHRGDGRIMHFDILVDASESGAETVYGYGRSYLATKPFETGGLTSEACQFCHHKNADADLERQIAQQGYFIIEMEHCD